MKTLAAVMLLTVSTVIAQDYNYAAAALARQREQANQEEVQQLRILNRQIFEARVEQISTSFRAEMDAHFAAKALQTAIEAQTKATRDQANEARWQETLRRVRMGE